MRRSLATRLRRCNGGVTTSVVASPTVQVPTLIYCGTNDNLEPKARTAQAIPHALFVALEGLDHAAAINRSAVVLPHVTVFLGRHAGHDEQPATTRDDQFS